LQLSFYLYTEVFLETSIDAAVAPSKLSKLPMALEATGYACDKTGGVSKILHASRVKSAACMQNLADTACFVTKTVFCSYGVGCESN